MDDPRLLALLEGPLEVGEGSAEFAGDVDAETLASQSALAELAIPLGARLECASCCVRNPRKFNGRACSIVAIGDHPETPRTLSMVTIQTRLSGCTNQGTPRNNNQLCAMGTQVDWEPIARQQGADALSDNVATSSQQTVAAATADDGPPTVTPQRVLYTAETDSGRIAAKVHDLLNDPSFPYTILRHCCSSG